MATTLYLTKAVSDTHLGTNNGRLRDGTGIGWLPLALSASRGVAATFSSATATVTGATSGIEIAYPSAASPVEWVSPPVAADVTIAGTITANIWGAENSMTANVAINIVVEVIRANALGTANSNTLVEIARSTRTVELATADGVNNFTVTPTSTVVNRGDRLRVRVFGDDSAAATMATGFTFNITFDGTTAAASGDTYLTFTENFSFESAPGTTTPITIAQTGVSTFGHSSANDMHGSSFVADGDFLDSVSLYLGRLNSPADSAVIELQTDASGAPSGSVVSAIATVAPASLPNGTVALFTWSSLGVAISDGSTYWIVLRRSGALDSTNNYQHGVLSATDDPRVVAKLYVSGAWGSASSFEVSQTVVMRDTTSVSRLYLTDTASAVSTASVDKEAWTSRGSGVVTSVTDTYSGWTAPVQATATARTLGSYIDNTAGTFATNQTLQQATTGALAQSFLTSSALTLGEVRLGLRKFGTPTDDVIVEIQTDSGGSPSGTVVGTVSTVAGSALTTTQTTYTYSCSIPLSASTTYWLVTRRTGATDTINYYETYRSSTSVYADGLFKNRVTSTWNSPGGDLLFYLGEVTAGGAVLDWFTKPLAAFTLTGMAVLNIRALESNAAANASLRCEIARVEGDGTSPTVWSSWCCAPNDAFGTGELTTSEVARTINLSGDDLAITDGQRIRIRLYNEDISNAPLVTGHTVTRYYNGTSAAASGDTYITFPQTLTEYASGPYTYTKAGYGKEAG